MAGTAHVSVWRTVRGNVLAMGLVSFWTDFATECIYPLLPVFFAALVGEQSAVLYLGIMESFSETTSAVMKVFSGRVSDYWGKRKALVLVGYGISSLVRPTTGFAPWAWLVVVVRVVDRVGKGIRTSPRDALISDSVPEAARGVAFSFHRAMDHLGAICGPFLAFGVLYALLHKFVWMGDVGQPTKEDEMALRVLFLTAFVPGLLALLTIVVLVREIPPQHSGTAPRGDHAAGPGPSETYGTIATADRDDSAVAVGANAGQQDSLGGLPAASTRGGAGKPKMVFDFAAWRQLPRAFYYYVGIVFIFGVGNSSDLFLVMLGATRYHFNLLKVLILWVSLHVAKVMASVPCGWLSDRLGRRPLIIVGWAVYAGVYLLVALCNHEWQFWFAIVCYGLYYGLSEGAERALVSEFSTSEMRGSAYGLFHAASGLAALPSSLIFGVFWNALGPTVAYSIGAGIAMLCVVLLIALSVHTRGAHTEVGGEWPRARDVSGVRAAGPGGGEGEGDSDPDETRALLPDHIRATGPQYAVQ